MKNTNGRLILAENIPLQKPRVIRINPTTACNLRCQFCLCATDTWKKLHPAKNLSFSYFTEIIDAIKTSFGTVNAINIDGTGEPLCNPRFAEMIKYAADAGVSNHIKTTSNGVLLTNEKSLQLANSGLSLIHISVNGLSDDDYLKHCGKKIDFDNYVSQIKYFYQNKETTKIYIKIINYMVPDEESKKRFFDIFTPICDEIAIENLVESNSTKDINFSEFAPSGINHNLTLLNHERLDDSTICTLPFYNMRICPDGGVSPCTLSEDPIKIANMNDHSLKEIWEHEFFEFQMKMLHGVKTTGEFCSNCDDYKNQVQPEDRLDARVAELIDRYTVLKSRHLNQGN